MRKLSMAVAAAALSVGTVGVSAPALSQVALPVQGGLVNVAIPVAAETGDVNILSGFLNNVEVNALNELLKNSQVIVQVPIGVAANVCNIAANVLAQGGGLTDGKCTAATGSQALAQAVRKQKLNK